MNRDSHYPASLRCSLCGTGTAGSEAPSPARLGLTYQVVVACASCGKSFVALSRN